VIIFRFVSVTGDNFKGCEQFYRKIFPGVVERSSCEWKTGPAQNKTSEKEWSLVLGTDHPPMVKSVKFV
jgi:hypothetical protein